MTIGALGVITGGVVFAVTLIVSVASEKRPPGSVTRKVKLALVAEQEATTSAGTRAELSIAIPENVTPLTVAEPPPLTVTVNALGGSSLSLTVATCELELAAPLDREIVAPVIVGGVFCTSKAPMSVPSPPVALGTPES